MSSSKKGQIEEVMPQGGLVYSQRVEQQVKWQLSKPKVMPIKSMELRRLEEMEKAANQKLGDGEGDREETV